MSEKLHYRFVNLKSFPKNTLKWRSNDFDAIFTKDSTTFYAELPFYVLWLRLFRIWSHSFTISILDKQRNKCKRQWHDGRASGRASRRSALLLGYPGHKIFSIRTQCKATHSHKLPTAAVNSKIAYTKNKSKADLLFLRD